MVNVGERNSNEVGEGAAATGAVAFKRSGLFNWTLEFWSCPGSPTFQGHVLAGDRARTRPGASESLALGFFH